MAECIEREAVLEMLDGIYDCNDMVFDNDSCVGADCRSCRWRDTKKYIRKRVERIPAADVVEVVRCRDCIRADEYGHCEMQGFWGTRDDYCSRGVKRDG